MGAGLSEKDWQQQVVDFARLCGWWTHHHLHSRGSTPGWPDLVLVRVPELLLVELKTDTGKLSAEQVAVLAMLDGCGVETHVWRPRDWDAVHDRLLRR